jgi:ankyrin repeat protein
MTIRAVVHTLCSRPSGLLRSPLFRDCEVIESRTFLQGAIITKRPNVVRKILQLPDTPTSILNDHSARDYFASPLWLAGESGNIDIIEILLSARLRALDEAREQALKGAIYGGHLEAVRFIFDSRWGPANFISSAHCIEEPLVSGTTRSQDIDFYAQLYSLVASYCTARCPIELDLYDLNDILHEVAGWHTQRVDIVAHLLDAGAILQEKKYPLNRARNDFNGSTWEPRKPWNPLREAVKGGNEKIVQLLLDRGADPNSTDDDVLWHAVKLGRLEIVRMLVENGAKIEQVCHPAAALFTGRIERRPLLAIAALLEHIGLYQFLLEHHATLESLKWAGIALHEAQAEGMESVATLLTDLGAVPRPPALLDQDLIRLRDLVSGKISKRPVGPY